MAHRWHESWSTELYDPACHTGFKKEEKKKTFWSDRDVSHRAHAFLLFGLVNAALGFMAINSNGQFSSYAATWATFNRKQSRSFSIGYSKGWNSVAMLG